MSKLCPVCGTTYLDALVFCPADGSTLRAADLGGDLVGSVIADRYLVTDLLGEGGMGTVYLARHVRLPQQAAIKVLRRDMLRDAAAVARFNREASNASRIDHDRVARVYDFGETDDGTVYLAMEFVQGKTLKVLLADGGPMAPERAAGLVRQIADGLDAAHRMGIVHRDLKPDNILVIDDGDGDERVKIVDFGIAKAFGNDEGGHGLTRTGMVVGTPEFMSPEQLLGQALDARSDIYALAIVAYTCLTGDLPFANDTPDHGMTARLMTPPRPLLAVRPTVRWPPAVQQVFDQGLARQPDDRPASAGAFARALSTALEAWVASTAAAASRPGAPRAEPVAPKAPAGPSFAPLAAPAAVAWTPGGGLAPPSPVTPAGKSSSMLVVGGVLAALVVVGGGGFFAMRSRGGSPSRTDSTASVAAAATPQTPVAPSGGTPAVVPSPNAGAGAAPASVPDRSAATPVTGGASRPAVPTATTTPAAPPTATPPRVASGGDNAVVRHTLDSLAQALDPNTADEAAARAALPALRALMPKLTSSDDSTWATVRTIEAHLLLNDSRQACVAVRQARMLARTAAQREAVHRYDTGLSCGS